MATERHDGKTRIIVDTDDAIPGGHRNEVIAVGIRDDGERSALRLNDSNELKTTATGGGGGGGGACTIANGADVAEGSTTDVAVTGDNAGTVSAKLRGINKVLASVWDSIGGFLKISDGGGTLSVDDGGGSLTVDGPLTDAQLRAAPIEVSGDFTSDGLTDAELRASAVPVSAASLPLPTGASTEATLAAVLAKIIAAPATEATLAAVLAAVEELAELTETQPVSAVALPLPSGAATEATLALIKAKTDNLDVALSTRTKPADAQHVIVDSGTTAVTDGGGSITVDGSVAVSGMSVLDDLTDSGTTLNNGDFVVFDMNGCGGGALQLVSSGSAGFTLEGSVTGSDWITLYAVESRTIEPILGTLSSITTPGTLYFFATPGLKQIRLTQTVTFGGTTTIYFRASAGSFPIRQITPMPAPSAISAVNTSGTISSPGGSITLSVGNRSNGLFILSGTWSGTVQVTINGTVVPFFNVLNLNGATPIAGTTVNGTYWVNCCTGNPSIQASTLISGTVNVSIQATGDCGFNYSYIMAGGGRDDLGKTNSIAHIAGSRGLMPLAVQKNVRGTLNTGGDLGYAPLQLNSSGDLRVDASAVPIPVTDNGGTLSIDDGGGSVTVDGTITQNINTGRTELRFYAVAAAAGSTGTETAISLTKSSGTGATSSANSFVVTSGKRFRITHISVAARGHATATIQATTFNLRVNTAGGVGTTSTPIILSARVATPATASAWDRYTIPLGEGMEIPGDGTLQFGITAAAVFTANAPTWDVTIIGYEYTP